MVSGIIYFLRYKQAFNSIFLTSYYRRAMVSESNFVSYFNLIFSTEVRSYSKDNGKGLL